MTDHIQPTQRDIDYLQANPEVADKFDKQFGEGKSKEYTQPQPSAEQPIPTEQDIQYLQANPDVAGKFEQQFGVGTASAVLSPEATPEEPSGLNLVGNTIDIVEGLNAGAEGAINGTLDAIDSFDKAVSKKLDEFGIPSRLSLTDDDGNFSPSLNFSDEVADKPNIFEARLNVAQQPLSLAGRGAQGISQFLIGMAGAGKLTGLKGLSGGFFNGALADGVVFDPNDGNLSTLMAENDMAIPLLTAALATDPDDPEWLNRMRNVTEGAIGGGVADTIIRGFGGLARKAKGAKMGGKAGDELIAKGQAEIDEVADQLEVMDELGVTPDTIPTPTQQAPTPTLRKEKPIIDGETLKAALKDKDSITEADLTNSDWFNTSKMDGPMEAQAVIESVGKALDESGAMAKLGVGSPETFEATIKAAQADLADMVGIGTKRFERRLSQMATTGQDTAKTIVAGKMTLQTVGTEINKVADELTAMAAAGRSDVAVEARLVDLLETHANVQAHLKSVQTSAARATSAGRIRTGAGLDVNALQDKVKSYGGSKKLNKLAGDLLDAQGPMQRAKLIRRITKTRVMDVVNEFYINSILSGPKTHLVNVTSNAINVAILPAERIMGGAIQGLAGRGFKQSREGVAQYMALRSTVMDATRLAGRSFKAEASILDSIVKVEFAKGKGKSISSESLGVNGSAFGGKLLDGIGTAIRVPTRFLQAEDEFFKQLMFRSRLQAELSVAAADMTEAQLKKAGYASKGDFIQSEFDSSFNGLQDLSDEWGNLVQAGKVIDDAAVKEQWIAEHLGGFRAGNKRAEDAVRVARAATFTTPLEKGTFTNGYQQLANRHPLLRQITPFVQTPVNILNKAFDRTPALNLVRKQYRDRISSPDKAIQAEAIGEMATGVAIATSLFMLASEGRISGGGPLDGKKRRQWMADKNWQAYSINIGTEEEPNWIEYRRLDPHGFLFGIVGDMAEMQQASELDPSLDTAGMFAMFVSAIGNNVTSKTWLQGVSDVVEVMNSKDRPDKAQRWAENKVASFVPFSAFQRQTNQSLSDGQKEARGFIDKIKQNTLGMSDDLPTRFNWLTGEEMETPSHYLGYIKRRKGDGDIVSKELRRLNFGFTGPDRRIGEIELSGEMFQDWSRLMGTVRIGGRTLHERLERTIQTKRYDLNRDRVPDGIGDPSESHRVSEVASLISRYKSKARHELMDEHPELEDAHRAFEKFERRAKFGKAVEGERENLILGF